MRADVDRNVPAFADEAHGAPDLGAADGVEAGVAVATRNAFLVKAEMKKGAEDEE